MTTVSYIKKTIKACLPYGVISLLGSIKEKGKHTKILTILNKDYASIISAYKDRHDNTTKPISPYPVWVCWWQGEAAMPEVVKICYSQLIKKANGHTINLITKDNYQYFISLPSYILEKVHKGYISLTHLSDIIRVVLLYQYGGLWIDSTIYVLHDLRDFDTPLFSLRRLRDDVLVPECRWSAHFFYAGKSHLLFSFLQNIFFEYWKKNNHLIDYLLIDYCIMLAYKNIPEIQKDIDNIPFTNPHVHWFRSNLNRKYNEQSFKYLKDSTQFCKLTYRHGEYKEKTEEGLLTYYGYIKSKV
jgi:hypothetical protein